jgi:hypothetical protein
MPIVLNEFEKVGILDDLLSQSLHNKDGVYFRTPFSKGHDRLGTLSVAKLPKGVMKYDFVAANLGQHHLGALLLSHAESLPTFEILWNRRFSSGPSQCSYSARGPFFPLFCPSVFNSGFLPIAHILELSLTSIQGQYIGEYK